MSFANQLASDLDNVFLNADEFAVAVSFEYGTTRTTDTINAVLDQVAGRQIAVVTKKSDHTETPQNGDILTVGGVPYTVTEINDPSDATYRFLVVAPDAVR